jgi:tripartite-type tricarboxylate transporter receptor subunit TctC
MCAPARTPRAVIERLNAALNASLAQPEVRDRLAEQGADVQPTTPQQFAQFMRDEVAKWTRLVRETGIRVK